MLYWLLVVPSQEHNTRAQVGANLHPFSVQVSQSLSENQVQVQVKPYRHAEDKVRKSATDVSPLAYELRRRSSGDFSDGYTLTYSVAEIPDNVIGDSGGLIFGLAAFLEMIKYRSSKFQELAATGTLEKNGDVGAVDHVPAKLAAAIEQLSQGSRVFYPRACHAEVTQALLDSAQQKDIQLLSTDSLQDALSQLGIPVRGVWPGNPYPGLQSFTVKDSPIYFGRQALTKALCERLLRREAAKCPGLLIQGSSGSGKSSFAQAGLVASLADPFNPIKALTDQPLDYVVWKPSAASSYSEAALASSIFEHLTKKLWRALVFRTLQNEPAPENLDQLATQLEKCGLEGCRLVWVIDQMEEIFTLGFSPEAVSNFAQLVLRLQALGVWVIGTMRIEFDTHYQAQEALVQAFGQELPDPGVYNLRALSTVDLRKVIEEPAKQALVGFGCDEKGDSLIDLILEDARKHNISQDHQDKSDVLPLLQFALSELYKKESDRKKAPDKEANAKKTQANEDQTSHRDLDKPGLLLTHEVYEQDGGLKGAIREKAKGVFAKLNEEEQKVLPRLLRALVPGAVEGMTETAIPIELKRWPDQDSAIRKLIAALAHDSARLMVIDKDKASLVHEAVLTHWEESKEILKNTREQRRSATTMQHRAKDWVKRDRTKHALLTSKLDLDIAKKLLSELGDELNDWEHLAEFLRASINAHHKIRNLQRIFVGLVSAVFILGALLWFWSDREKQIEIRTQNSNTLVDLSLKETESGDAMTGILLALEAMRGNVGQAASSDAEMALSNSLLKNREVALVRYQRDSIWNVAINPISGNVVTISDDNPNRGASAIWHDQNTGASNSINKSEGSSYIGNTIFSPDGTLLATIDQLAMHIRNARLPNSNHTVLPNMHHCSLSNSRNAIKFSADSKKIAWACEGNGVISVWDINTHKRTDLLVNKKLDISQLAFNHDGGHLIGMDDSHNVYIWDLTAPEPTMLPLMDKDSFLRYEISSDGDHLLSINERGTKQSLLWDLSGPKPTYINFKPELGRFDPIALSTDGQSIAFSRGGGLLEVWFLNGTQWSVMHLRVLEGIASVTFSDDGKFVAVNLINNSVQVFDLSGNRPSITLAGHTDTIHTVAFASQNHFLITASLDGTVRYWNLERTSMEISPKLGKIYDFDTNGVWISRDRHYQLEWSWDQNSKGSGFYQLRNLRTSEPPKMLLPTLGVRSNGACAFSPDVTRVVCSLESGTLRVWDLTDKNLPSFDWTSQSEQIDDLSFTLDSHKLLTASHDGSGRIWDFLQPKLAPVLLPGRDGDSGVSTWGYTHANISPDGKHVAICWFDEVLRVWNLTEKQPTFVDLQLGDRANSVNFSPQGDRVITVFSNGAAIWNVTDTQTKPILLRGLRGENFDQAVFSPDGRRIATLFSNSTVSIWNLNAKIPKGLILGSALFKDQYNQFGQFLSREQSNIDFGPDGHLVASLGGNTQDWDIPEGQELVKKATVALTRCLSNEQRYTFGLPVLSQDDRKLVPHPPC